MLFVLNDLSNCHDCDARVVLNDSLKNLRYIPKYLNKGKWCNLSLCRMFGRTKFGHIVKDFE